METLAPQAVVFLNPHCRAGSGLHHWQKFSSELHSMQFKSVIETSTGWIDQFRKSVLEGNRFFIAAGGDGTVHLVLNALLQAKGEIPLSEFTFGAIGLGSSNDFHKPARQKIAGYPVKINYAERKLRDLVEANITSTGKLPERRVFAVSSSIGLVAEANLFFNSGRGLIELLKKYWTDGAILFAALRTIARFQTVPVRFQSFGDFDSPRAQWVARLTSFHVLKTPFLSGSFRFDTPADPSNGKLRICFMEDMSLTETLKTLIDMARGKFLPSGSRPDSKRKSFEALRWSARTDEKLPLELDGELYEFKEVDFSVLPERIYQCS
jgi:diacylglycerol kinase (ATP)